MPSPEPLLKHAHIHCQSLALYPLSLAISLRPTLHPSGYTTALATDLSSSDVLRRRFQINTMSGMGYQYSSIWDAVRVIVAEEGMRGLFKGIGPNLLKVAPSMASSWLSFEMTRDFLVSMNDRE